jgi:uncharacterized protein YggE
MKRFFLLFLGTLIFCYNGLAQALVQTPLPPLVSVAGIGEIKVQPDEIVLNVGIDIRHKNLDEARQQSDDRVKDLLQFLKKSGIEDKYIQTTHLSVYPNYIGEYGATTPEFYMTQKSVSIIIKNIKRFDEILTGIYKTGANRVEGVEYRTSELQKYREQARKLAMQSAKQKAAALTGELGAKVGRVYNITESASEGYPTPYYRGRVANKMMEAGDAAATGPTIAVGQIMVRSSVEVSFVIE